MFYSSAFRIRATSRGHVGYPRNGGNKNPSFSYDPVTKWLITHTYICIYIYMGYIYMGYVHICTCIQFIYNMISLSFPRLHLAVARHSGLLQPSCKGALCWFSPHGASAPWDSETPKALWVCHWPGTPGTNGSRTAVVLSHSGTMGHEISHGYGCGGFPCAKDQGLVKQKKWCRKMVKERVAWASKIGMSTPESWK